METGKVYFAAACCIAYSLDVFRFPSRKPALLHIGNICLCDPLRRNLPEHCVESPPYGIGRLARYLLCNDTHYQCCERVGSDLPFNQTDHLDCGAELFVAPFQVLYLSLSVPEYFHAQPLCRLSGPNSGSLSMLTRTRCQFLTLSSAETDQGRIADLTCYQATTHLKSALAVDRKDFRPSLCLFLRVPTRRVDLRVVVELISIEAAQRL